MRHTITKLVNKMLFTDNVLQRISISQHILKHLRKPAYGAGRISEAVKAHFAKRVKACALHPSSHHRESVCEIAKFYDTHADEDIPPMSKAA